MRVTLHAITTALQALLDKRGVGPGDQVLLSTLRDDWKTTHLRDQDFQLCILALEDAGAAEIIPTATGEALFLLGPVVLRCWGRGNPVLRFFEESGTQRALSDASCRNDSGPVAHDRRTRQ